jgi:hypothetical protein
MTGKAFMNAVANGELDILQVLLDILTETGTAYCVIGGLAVNAYAEPVVSLDLDIIVASEDIEKVISGAEGQGLRVERSEHSTNLTSPKSNLRIQLQMGKWYQLFIPRAKERDVLGYRMQVADVSDVLQGKIWAYKDQQRRKSKRQKDLADIMRLVEANPTLEELLPPEIRKELQ